MPELSDDTSRQTPKPDESTITTTASGERSLAVARDINAPTFLGNITNSVIKISSGLPSWLRVILLITLVSGILTLVGVVVLVLQGLDDDQTIASPIIPNSSLFEVVIPPSSGLAITALAIEDGEKTRLWIGTQSGSQYALYQLETAPQVLEHVLDVDEQIIGLTIDCKGNIWLLLNRIGTLVYRPQTGQHSTLLNIKTTENWLTKNTTQAIATHCLEDDETVEVWLGREGVHTLYYQEDYATLETITFLSPEEDLVFTASQELTNVQALQYVDESQTLWIADRNGQLLSVSLKGVLEPRLISLEDSTLWSLSQTPDGRGVWAGTSEQLVQIDDESQNTIPLVQDDGATLDSRAMVIAIDERWVWFGDRCPEASATCWPLGVHSRGSLAQADMGNRKEVRAIVIDPLGTVWIGTEAGLILFPKL